MAKLLEIKFFYDHFTQNDICGMFNLGHLLTVVVFIASMALALFFSRKMTESQVKKMHLIVAIVVSVLEVVKITLRVVKGQSYDSYMPLYFCSLFIFAIWLSLSKNPKINRFGYAYITMGGIVASLSFTIYPSTSLAIFPIWHPATFHSFIYHWIMFYTGIMLLIKNQYIPNKQDSLRYFIFIVCACIPSLILNKYLGTNCMFLRDAFKLPVLDGILNYSKVIYIAIMVIAQAVLVYWLSYGLYKLILCIKNKIKKNKGEQN